MDISPILEFLMPDELKKALMEWRNDHYSFAVFLFFEFLVGFVLVYFWDNSSLNLVVSKYLISKAKFSLFSIDSTFVSKFCKFRINLFFISIIFNEIY